MIVATLVAAQLFLLGALAVAPFRLARAGEPARQAWALFCVPLLLLSALLALLHLRIAPDAALRWGISWPPLALPARLLLVVLVAGALATALVAAGWRKLEPAAWRFAGALAVTLAAGAAFAGELLRIGTGESGTLPALLVAAAARLALTLAAGECVTGRVRFLAPIAAALLPVAYFLLPAPVALGLRADLLTLGAAVLLLSGAPLLPARWGRIAAALGVLLAALYFARAAAVSASYEDRAALAASAPASA
jgi:hypothetical protein